MILFTSRKWSKLLLRSPKPLPILHFRFSATRQKAAFEISAGFIERKKTAASHPIRYRQAFRVLPALTQAYITLHKHCTSLHPPALLSNTQPKPAQTLRKLAKKSRLAGGCQLFFEYRLLLLFADCFLRRN
jgi:hypothetical protein